MSMRNKAKIDLKGELITRTLKVDHPNDINLPPEKRRVLFEVQINIEKINHKYIESINRFHVDYSMKDDSKS